MARPIDISDASKAEYHNVAKVISHGRAAWTARERLNTLTTFSSDYSVLAASTATTPGGQRYYYFLLAKSTGQLTQLISTDLTDFAEVAIDAQVIDRSLPVSIQTTPYGRIIANGNGISAPLHAHVGSALRPAGKVDLTATDGQALNTDNPALPLPTGPVSSWSDRLVWTDKNTIIISYPGTEARTITTQGLIAMDGPVLDIAKSVSDDLYAVTGQSYTVLPKEGLQSVIYDAATARSTRYHGLRPGNVASCPYGVFGLLGQSVVNLESGTQINLYDNRRMRHYAAQPATAAPTDLRLCARIQGYSKGLAILHEDGQAILIDMANQHVMWLSDAALTKKIINVIDLPDGHLMIVSQNGIYVMAGDNTTATCAISTPIDTNSERVTALSYRLLTQADGLSSVSTFMPASAERTVLPGATTNSNAVNTATTKYDALHLRQAELIAHEHNHAVSSYDPFLEIKIPDNVLITQVNLSKEAVTGLTNKRQQ